MTVRFFLQISILKERVNEAIEACAKVKKDALKDAISNLPREFQETVQACFDVARRKGPRGRRYTNEWVYRCMQMRIESTSLYEHIRL